MIPHWSQMRKKRFFRGQRKHVGGVAVSASPDIRWGRDALVAYVYAMIQT
jgi:hypothetical protein